MKNTKLELLAPAQNADIGISAIKHGADAVYIGASSFGARKMASNNLDEIKRLIDFAHIYNAKIYITINTILSDKELIEAEKLINKLYNIGVDALIIQDMGLLELDLPPVNLHASTQCNIRTLEKVKFFEEIGMKRAILARELSIEQIKNISKETNIELEAFIHGALCVCYSGQCYMSAYVGKRSANRGECAQACRKKYSLLDNNGKIIAKNKHLLSLKDFCAEKYIDSLINAGVKSFKIEGRLKDENYVKNVVLYYRKLLDKYEKTSDGIIISDFEPDINKTFNRGYTTYFLNNKDNIFNFETPKSTGEFLGNISKIGKNYFEIDKNINISPQDGLCVIGNNDLDGFLVNKTEGNKIFPNKKVILKVGDKIYRNKNVEFEKILKNSKTKRVINTEITVYLDKIKASDGKNEATIPYNFSEFAKNEEKMKDVVINSFKKTGESCFCAEKIIFKTEKIPFLSLSNINSLRRDLYEQLKELRIKNYKKEIFQKTKYAKFKDLPQDYRLNIYNKKAENFYKNCGVKDIEYAPEYTNNYKNKELMRSKHCIRHALGLCLKEGNGKNSLFLLDGSNKFSLEFDCKNCEMVIKAE